MFKLILLQVNALLLILSLFFAPRFSTTFANSNLILNPSFEEGIDFPNNWSITNDNFCGQQSSSVTVATQWNSSIANSGTKSVGFVNIDRPDNSDQTHFRTKIVSNYIELSSTNQFYRLNGKTTSLANSYNILPTIFICFYNSAGIKVGDTSTSTLYPPNNQAWYGFNFNSQKIDYIPPGTSKIRIALQARCYKDYFSGTKCSGSIWFDDINLNPIGNITTHIFEDLNKNGIQDSGEQNLRQHRVNFYNGFDCQPLSGRFQNSPTDVNGITIAKDQPFGNYSVSQDFTYHQDWENTTPYCQNITVHDNKPPTIEIGAIKKPSFPYVSQLNPIWASNEYDHAAQIGPFFCGSTIGGCGCAITSAAMLLKFHSATKSPTGEDTSPDSLNTWLKNNNGYAFGALKWNSVAAYSVKANQNFGTQKIRFMGTSTANDFATLDLDLSANKPQILQEPGHFIAAYAKQNPTYSIKDPAYEARSTLSEYSNSFLSARRFEKTNTDLSTIYISPPPPNELFLTDSQGRRVGKDAESGAIYQEIPNSFYFLEPALTNQNQPTPQTPPANTGVNTLVIINPGQDTFTIHSQSGPIDFSAYDINGEIKTIEQSTASLETFEMSYSPEPGADFQVLQKIAVDVKPHNQNQDTGIIPIAILSDINFDAQNIDYQTIQLLPDKVAPVKFPLLISRSQYRLKDMLIFFLLEEYPTYLANQELCLTGRTVNGTAFKGCNSP